MNDSSEEKQRYLDLLAEKYPNSRAVFTEIINLKAILNLPKGTEHFMSDLHGEYEAFNHILNNCSGVVREKVRMVSHLAPAEQAELCTLIYYPREKLARLRSQKRITPEWYKATLGQLIELAKFLSSKYTRSKVRKAIPQEYSYIIDELLHAQPDEDNNRAVYHAKILDTILETGSADDFICSLAALIKRLAVDRLHIVGDIFDRGAHADRILDILMKYHSLDFEWGNHDILWMGAAAGSLACTANVLRNNINYGNLEILESGYGIPLRPLALFAQKTYRTEDGFSPLQKAIAVILFKLEGQIILRHPEYDMDDRLLLDKIDLKAACARIGGQTFALKTTDFPTLDPADPYHLSPEEDAIITGLQFNFSHSERLCRQIGFLYANGSMYRCFNQNLLFHGCIPLEENGNFTAVECEGKNYQGKAYMDYADRTARRAWREHDQNDLDFMWYLWCGKNSPLSGRTVKTFERTYFSDASSQVEPKDPYYTLCGSEQTVQMILHEFGLFSDRSHVINGHTPVLVSKGEKPVKANGKLIVIDGGFCKAYQPTTGIAGYTLIFNSHGLRIKAHRPFQSLEKALEENADIESDSMEFETEHKRVMVENTDTGCQIKADLHDLEALLAAYRSGAIREKSAQ